MRIAHLIIAHKNPAQLERLISTMKHPDADVYIHIDKKVSQDPFNYLANQEQVKFIKERIYCNWGGFSIVETVVQSIDEIIASGVQYDFINLLSAQDYPIKPIDDIHEFLNQRLGYSFVSFDESNDTKWWQEAGNRYKKYHFTDMNFNGKYFIQKIINAILPERKLPSALKNLYGGNRSCWWTLSSEAALYLSDFLKTNSKLTSFLKLTWGADEFIIPSILMNSHLKDQTINENYRYMQWTYGETHPKLLAIDDYTKIIESDMLYARKFDIDTDIAIMNKLDTYLSNK